MATNQIPEQTPDPAVTTATSRPTIVQPARLYVEAAGSPLNQEGVAGVALAESPMVRWGAVWVGLLTAMSLFVLLSLLGLAIGLTNVNGPAVVATGKAPADAVRNSAIWLGFAGILAFLIGGYVAGSTAAVFSRGRAALQGAMTFFLAVPVFVVLAALDVTANLGNLGRAIHGNWTLFQAASSGATARNVAWWTLVVLVVALAVSALGGASGARPPRRRG